MRNDELEVKFSTERGPRLPVYHNFFISQKKDTTKTRQTFTITSSNNKHILELKRQYLSVRWSGYRGILSTLTTDRRVNKNAGHHASPTKGSPSQDTTTHAPCIDILDTWVRCPCQTRNGTETQRQVAAPGAVGRASAPEKTRPPSVVKPFLVPPTQERQSTKTN